MERSPKHLITAFEQISGPLQEKYSQISNFTDRSLTAEYAEKHYYISQIRIHTETRTNNNSLEVVTRITHTDLLNMAARRLDQHKTQ